MAKKTITLKHGSKEWNDLRKKATVSVPGKYSSLYFLNDMILGHGEVVPMTYRAHYALCLFAEGMTGIPEIDNCRVKMMLVPRGMGKSTLITKGQTIHDLIKYDDYAVGIANETGPMAESFLAMVRQEFEQNQLLRALFPERVWPSLSEADTWKADRIVIPRKKPNPTSPSILAAGAGKTVTGVHMNAWRIDDIISQNAAENAYRGSFTEIEETNRWIGRIQPLLKSPKRDPIHVIGTRWWEGDTYEYIEERFGHEEPREHFTWTLKLPDGEVQTLHLYRKGEIAVFKRSAIENGRSIFPERYTLEDLQMMQQEDPVFFAGQYLLEPTAGSAAEFDPDWLNYYEHDGDQLRYIGQDTRMHYVNPRELVVFMSVDPAISDSARAARSAVPVVGTNGTEIFLLEDWAERGVGMFDLAHRIVDFYGRYRPRHIFIETIVYQKALVEGLEAVARERGMPEIMGAVQTIPSHSGKSKNFRVYGLEPYFKSGRFYVHRTHSNFIQEYSTFPRAALRDVIDAISFQKDAWERISRAGDNHGNYSPQARKKAEQEKIARLRSAMGRGGGY